MGKCLKRDIWVLAGCCMSPLTLAMKDDGFPFRLTPLALELHFFSMYAPGIVGTGYLIKHIGPYAASGCGPLRSTSVRHPDTVVMNVKYT